jgi:YjbE family integral membrane protein
MWDMFTTSEFWVALGQIIIVNIMLSGDNAVVIALASRSLPPHQQRKAIIFGSLGAIVLRVILTFFAVLLLKLPFLKLAGGAALLWIGAGLLATDDDEGDLEAHANLWAAIRTIIVADFIMSLDNVLAVAGAAKDSWALIIFGLLVSIPIIVYCSTLVLKLMDRFPWIIILGGGLLGWIAAGMAIHDVAVRDWVSSNWPWAEYVLPAIGATIVMAIGWYLARSAAASKAGAVSDLAPEKPGH